MMWAIAKMLLDKNGSPAWKRVSNIMNLVQMQQNSGKQQNTFNDAVTNDGMYGSFGGF